MCPCGVGELDAEVRTDASKQRYLSDVTQFYSHLERWAIAAFNPTSRISEEYNWNREGRDNQPLSSEDVRRLYGAVESSEEELSCSRCVRGAFDRTWLRCYTFLR